MRAVKTFVKVVAVYRTDCSKCHVCKPTLNEVVLFLSVSQLSHLFDLNENKCLIMALAFVVVYEQLRLISQATNCYSNKP